MPVYAAFLRAVNVTGHGVIKMTDLQKLFTDAGFKDVSTFIQSGNVFFSTGGKNVNLIRKKIEKELDNYFSKEFTVFIRTPEEIHKIILNNPFRKISLSKESPVYVALLHEEPEKEKAELIQSAGSDIDTIVVKGKEIYCMAKKLKGKSVFSNQWIENKLKARATLRNISTIIKMDVLING